MLLFQRITYILIFIILFLVCLRNSTQVTFDIYVTKFTSPLIVLLFISFILGIIIGTLAILPKVYKQRKQLKNLQNATLSSANLNTNISSNIQTQSQNNTL
ncbi:MAG: Lipopolysaccharide assembly protein domain [Pseudomonadota bacterium]|jgi:uncharacterized integral membrane protein